MGTGMGYAEDNLDLNRVNEMEEQPRANTDGILQIVKQVHVISQQHLPYSSTVFT